MLVGNEHCKLPVELPAAVQEVWFVLTQCTGVGAVVVGVAIVKLVSALEQWSICIGLGRYSKKGTQFYFHCDYNVYVATLFKVLG